MGISPSSTISGEKWPSYFSVLRQPPRIPRLPHIISPGGVDVERVFPILNLKVIGMIHDGFPIHWRISKSVCKEK